MRYTLCASLDQKSSGEEYSSESQIEDEISIKFRIFDARRVRGFFVGERADWSLYEGTITSADKPFRSVIEPRSEEHRISNGSLCNPMLRRREGNVYSRLRFSPSVLFSSLPAFLSPLLPMLPSQLIGINQDLPIPGAAKSYYTVATDL